MHTVCAKTGSEQMLAVKQASQNENALEHFILEMLARICLQILAAK